MSRPERIATIAARYLAHLARQENTMTSADPDAWMTADPEIWVRTETSGHSADTEEAGDPLGILADRRRTALAIATAFESHDEPVTSAAQAADLVRRWAQMYAPTT